METVKCDYCGKKVVDVVIGYTEKYGEKISANFCSYDCSYNAFRESSTGKLNKLSYEKNMK